jgi:hypothetical protein
MNTWSMSCLLFTYCSCNSMNTRNIQSRGNEVWIPGVWAACFGHTALVTVRIHVKYNLEGLKYEYLEYELLAVDILYKTEQFCIVQTAQVALSLQPRQKLKEKPHKVFLAAWRTHCNENPIFVFPEKKLCGPSLNFHVHVSLGDLYIPRIGPHCP